MAGISSPGLGSGLDVNSIVSQLMTLEQRPLTDLTQKEAQYTAQVSAYGSLKGAISSFQSAVSALATPTKFTALKASVGDTSAATVSAAPNASPASYSMEVQQLAQSQKLKSAAFADTGTAIGTGTLTISFGTYSGDNFTLNADKAAKSITIGAGQNTLTGIRDAINAAGAGVTAGIINDGTGYRLTLTSQDSGTANAVRIQVADDDTGNTDNAGLSQMAFDARTVSGVQNLTESVAAKDAKVVLDGITVTKPSNTISDAIQGVTLNLTGETDSPTTLTVAKDTAGITSSVNTFVKAYNDLNKTITSLTQYDSVNQKASILTGEATVRSLQSQLRSVFNSSLATAGGGYSSLSDIGITFQTDGTLKLDQTKLDAAMKDGTKDISTLFAAVGKSDDAQVSFSASTKDTRNGNYAVKVTQLATQGKSVGSTPAALAITTGVNDTLSFNVDGQSGSITIAAGNYTADSLAAEIQAKVNGISALSDNGIKVGVTQSGGVLSITSARYGSASNVSITGGSAAADILGTPVETAGVDVAGTIGGIFATGSGQTLTGAGNAAGLALMITGGATGDRGTVRFARGYADSLNKTATDMLADNSQLDSRMDGINASIKDIDKRKDDLQTRLSATETRLRAQYSALDATMSQMQSLSAQLTQQLASLPRIS